MSIHARVVGALFLLLVPGAMLHADARRQLIVHVPRASDRLDVEAELARRGGSVVEELPALGLLLVEFPEARAAAGALAPLAALAGIGFVEPNGTGSGGGGIGPPLDTFFGQQWPLANTGQDGGVPGADVEALGAWELTRGSPGVLVAVLDSGIALGHVEFAGRIVPGFDFVNEDDVPADDHGHGTFVTGILAANADNAFGLAGVDQECRILPVKVLDRFNAGTSFDFAQGLTFAADAGADVVNMSLINYPASSALVMAIGYARDAGCVLVACAGNGGIGNADVSFPGRSPLVISVGATSRTDARASFSATGAALDLVAPGLDVPATWLGPEDTFVPFSGCSAATPMVAGIAALALALDPGLEHSELQQLLEDGAEDQVGPAAQDTPGRDDFFGHGRANALGTLCGLDGGPPVLIAPAAIRVECSSPLGIPGDDPAVIAALSAIGAVDDLDPTPEVAFTPPGLLQLGKLTPVAFTARDACGHERAQDLTVVAVDSRPPVATLALQPDRLAADGVLRPVTLDLLVTDACDPAPALLLAVYSDEPAAGREERDAEVDLRGTLFLRGERDPAGDGRVYLAVLTARDDWGNVTRTCATAVVPLDEGAAALADVLLEAELAALACAQTGAPPPTYRLLARSLLAPASRVASAR